MFQTDENKKLQPRVKVRLFLSAAAQLWTSLLFGRQPSDKTFIRSRCWFNSWSLTRLLRTRATSPLRARRSPSLGQNLLSGFLHASRWHELFLVFSPFTQQPAWYKQSKTLSWPRGSQVASTGSTQELHRFSEPADLKGSSSSFF